MFISNKEKEKIVNNIKYLLQGQTDINQTLVFIMNRIEKLERASKPTPKKNSNHLVAQPKKRGRPPKAKNA